MGQYSVLSKFNNYGEFYKTFERNNLNVGVVITIPLFAAKTSATVALAKSQLDRGGSDRRQETPGSAAGRACRRPAAYANWMPLGK